MSPNRNSNNDNSYAGGANGGRGRGHGNQNYGRGGRARGRNDGRNHHGRCHYCRKSTEHGWNDFTLRLSHQHQDETQHANAIQASFSDESTSHEWCTTTENADSEKFQVVIGDGAERPPSNDEICKGPAWVGQGSTSNCPIQSLVE